MQNSYSKYLVLFLDILGFTDKIRESESSGYQTDSIKNVLSEFENLVRYINELGDDSIPLKARMFSDSIVVTFPNPDQPSFTRMSSIILTCQAILLPTEYWIRGAATIGALYEKDNVMYGPSFIKAYETEKLAVWPRVIMHTSVVPLMRTIISDKTRKEPIYLTDDNGLTYYNYLYAHFTQVLTQEWECEYFKKPLPSIMPAWKLFNQHKGAIILSANSKKVQEHMDVLTKYHSLAVYHNEVVNSIYNCLPHTFNAALLKGSSDLIDLYTIIKRQWFQWTESQSLTVEETEYLEKKLNMLIAQKEVLKGSLIDLPKSFPSLYA